MKTIDKIETNENLSVFKTWSYFLSNENVINENERSININMFKKEPNKK